LGTFWAAVLGYRAPDLPPPLPTREVGEEDLNAICRLVDPDRMRPSFLFQRVPEPKVVKNRVHLDVGASPAGPGQRREIDEEAKRVVGLGGRILRSVTDDSGYFVVVQDPEGNEFCID